MYRVLLGHSQQHSNLVAQLSWSQAHEPTQTAKQHLSTTQGAGQHAAPSATCCTGWRSWHSPAATITVAVYITPVNRVRPQQRLSRCILRLLLRPLCRLLPLALLSPPPLAACPTYCFILRILYRLRQRVAVFMYRLRGCCCPPACPACLLLVLLRALVRADQAVVFTLTTCCGSIAGHPLGSCAGRARTARTCSNRYSTLNAYYLSL